MSWLSDVLPQIITTGTGTLLGGFSGWFFGRNRERQNTKSVELENVQSAIAIWRESAEELKNDVDELSKKQQELIEKNQELTDHIDKLERTVKKLELENQLLRKQLQNRK